MSCTCMYCMYMYMHMYKYMVHVDAVMPVFKVSHVSFDELVKISKKINIVGNIVITIIACNTVNIKV